MTEVALQPWEVAEGEEDIICPTLNHVGISTTRWDEMADWYRKVVGMRPNLVAEMPVPNGEGKVKMGFLSNDRANHRITLVTYPGLKEGARQGHARSGQHLAFEYDSWDDLFATYKRLKRIGVHVNSCECHGPSTNMYLQDPDGNVVELRVDNFGDWDKSTEYMRNAQNSSDKNPRGAGSVDFDKMIEAREAGASVDELFQRALAGEFTPEVLPDISFQL